MNYAEIKRRALLPEMAGLSSDAVAEAINLAVDTVWIDLRASWLEGFLRLQNRFQAIKRFANGVPTATVPQAILDQLLDLVDVMEQRSSVTEFSLSDPAKRAGLLTALGGLAALGLLTAEQVSIITQHCQKSVSALEIIGVNQLQGIDVLTALGT